MSGEWREGGINRSKGVNLRKLAWLSCLIFKLPSKVARKRGGARGGGPGTASGSYISISEAAGSVKTLDYAKHERRHRITASSEEESPVVYLEF